MAGNQVAVRSLGLRSALDRAGLVVCLAIGIVLGLGFATTSLRPIDGDLYWRAGHAAHYYGTTWGADPNSWYIYPPPLAQILGVIDWHVFMVLWMPLVFLAFWVATRWWSLVVLGVGIVAIMITGFDNPLANPVALAGIGNAQTLVAAAIVLGLRWPAAWAFVFLTKIGPGIGVLWYAARGEWRNLAIALGSTLPLLGVSLALAPDAWADFVRFAASNAGAPSPVPLVPVPLPVRVAMSGALIIWGARTGRLWTVPIAAGWAALALYQSSALSIWMAALPLMGEIRRPRSASLPSFVSARRLEPGTVPDDGLTRS